MFPKVKLEHVSVLMEGAIYIRSRGQTPQNLISKRESRKVTRVHYEGWS